MKIRGLATGVMLAAMFALAGIALLAAPPVTDVAVNAVFDAGGAIAGDGEVDSNGVYSDGVDCVRSYYQTRRGNYYLRTASGTIVCTKENPWAGRFVHLDFSFENRVPGFGPESCDIIIGAYGDTLDPCGPNAIQDVRLFADTMFSGSSTPLRLAFDPLANPGDHSVQFMLEFLENVPVSDEGGGSRSISDGHIAASLSVLTVTGRKAKYVEVGRYYMPFGLTVSPN